MKAIAQQTCCCEEHLPSDEAVLKRARSLCSEACFTVAPQHRRLRSTEPEDKAFIFRWWADDARIRVHIAYGFAGVRRLDLEAATNVDGKTQFKGLPEKVKSGTLTFHAVQGKREGLAIYDPQKSCTRGETDSIVLTAK